MDVQHIPARLQPRRQRGRAVRPRRRSAATGQSMGRPVAGVHAQQSAGRPVGSPTADAFTVAARRGTGVMTNSYDVLVIGGGIAGASIRYERARDMAGRVIDL